jgi:hypothetical protein
MIRYVSLLVTSLALFPAVRWQLGFVCLLVAGLALSLSWAARGDGVPGEVTADDD